VLTVDRIPNEAGSSERLVEGLHVRHRLVALRNLIGQRTDVIGVRQPAFLASRIYVSLRRLVVDNADLQLVQPLRIILLLSGSGFSARLPRLK
jgi:hypothetical protein